MPSAVITIELLRQVLERAHPRRTAKRACRGIIGRALERVRDHRTNHDVAGAGRRTQFVAIDPNGNLASKVEDGHSWTYEWNAENQLKRVTKDAVEVARYAYDPKGRRVEKVENGSTTTYSYEYANIVQESRAGSLLKYIHGPGVDEPLARQNVAGQVLYVHADALASELKETDGTGVAVFSRSYDSFGEPQVGGNAAGHAFTGREWDPAAGLYYYRARHYDPTIGRFASEDPIRFVAGVNFYSYVGGNPATKTDPTGLLTDEGDRWTNGVYCNVMGCYKPPDLPVCKSKQTFNECWTACRNASPYSSVPPLPSLASSASTIVGLAATGTARVCAWVGGPISAYDIGTATGCSMLCLASPCMVPGSNCGRCVVR